ncbi:hypothetical protein [Paenibacillus chibensis]|uniref:hypothetical protein n=1 Tax=Paenibacillus chibensis TaxID=59846 RepID=UPI000FD8BF05|nr:hypothetical protein [Paenibacillus chibensis]MEC0368618.1 hypothetical protein [Paenibacillus chibensis]
MTESYTFTEFATDLDIGHEIEFFYNDKKYAITRSRNGIVFSEYSGRDCIYQTVDEVLKDVSILGQKLENVWSEIVIHSIF